MTTPRKKTKLSHPCKGCGEHQSSDILIGLIENWAYKYENYITMMSSKGAFERGNMARKLAKELSRELATLLTESLKINK